MTITTNALEVLQTADTVVLTAAVRGEIDLNLLARKVLADRGMDHKGVWVGFSRARKLLGVEP